MHVADFFRVIDRRSNLIECFLCNHGCKIKEGGRGLCKVRENINGTLYSLVYGKLISENIDPIEKKPLFHLLPGTLSYSIATVGCNFRCLHCQNYEISQYPRLSPGNFPGAQRTPEAVVGAALEHGCKSISYTYVEPTIFFEFAYDTAKLAREAGLKNIFVSNGYTSPEATKKIAPLLDGNNIDLKAFSDKFYHQVCGARLAPVLATIRRMYELGIWLEVTTLIIPGWNDSDEELRAIAEFLVAIDPDIPWHVTRFYPTYKMMDRGHTPVSTLRRARTIGMEAGLQFVYTGNIPGEEGENTFCPNCETRLIDRLGFRATTEKMRGDSCASCGLKIPGVFL